MYLLKIKIICFTFLGGIKSWARDSVLALNDDTKLKIVEGELNNLRYTRNLVTFIECLEKSVCNAIDGTASALPSAHKVS